MSTRDELITTEKEESQEGAERAEGDGEHKSHTVGESTHGISVERDCHGEWAGAAVK